MIIIWHHSNRPFLDPVRAYQGHQSGQYSPQTSERVDAGTGSMTNSATAQGVLVAYCSNYVVISIPCLVMGIAAKGS